jgi:hypothetical protein
MILISEMQCRKCRSPTFMYIVLVYVRQNKKKRTMFGFLNGLASFPPAATE